MAGSPDGKQDEAGLGASVLNFHSFLHGGTSGLLTTVMVFPVYKTVFRIQILNTPVGQTVAQLSREGPLKLYRGVLPPLLMRTLNSTLLFGTQDSLVQQLSSQKVLPSSAIPAVAGFGAGVVEAVVLAPFERIQNVLQNSQNDQHLPTLKSILVRLKRQPLALGFYRAFLPITVRNALGSSLYFGLKAPMSNTVGEQGFSPLVSSFITGALSSMAVSLALYPMAVLVSNMQAQVGGEAEGVGACWRMLWRSRQRSVALLYRGGSLIILRSCVTWGIGTAIYDWQQKHSG